MRTEQNTTHGMSDTRLHEIWMGMCSRCKNTSSIASQLYGARGISVCEEWSRDFVSFYKWATNNGYADDLTIERIDVNGNYEPANCTWATKAQQTRNKRDTVHVTFKGETHCLAEWSSITGVPASTIKWRIVHGWALEDALFAPTLQTRGADGRWCNCLFGKTS
jgi:hypothetical protein